MNSATASPYLDALSRLAGPAWLEKQRRTALARFLRQGLPSPREEDWKYTSLAHLEHLGLHAPRPDTLAVPVIQDYPGALLAYQDDALVWQDTSLSRGRLDTLDQALLAEQVTCDWLGSQAGNGALAQLNSALWRHGACLRVPKDERLRQPVFLHFAAAEAEVMLYPRVLAVMEPRADAVLVEHYSGAPANRYWQNAVTEIVLEAGARLTHVILTEEGDAATHTGLVAVHLERDSTYRCLSISLGSQLARHEIRVELAGEGASARLDGLFIANTLIANGRAQIDHHLHVAHRAPRTTSRNTYRGVAAGRGRGVFDGRVVVHPGAFQSDALQSSRNLLLSPWAEIDAKPQLEIYADDVKCGHGATVGQLDPAQLFYLQSRGLDADHARALLLTGFANQALGLLDDTGLRDWLEPRLLARLAAATRPMETPR